MNSPYSNHNKAVNDVGDSAPVLISGLTTAELGITLAYIAELLTILSNSISLCLTLGNQHIEL